MGVSADWPAHMLRARGAARSWNGQRLFGVPCLRYCHAEISVLFERERCAKF